MAELDLAYAELDRLKEEAALRKILASAGQPPVSLSGHKLPPVIDRAAETHLPGAHSGPVTNSTAPDTKASTASLDDWLLTFPPF